MMVDLTPERLQELRRIAEAATPGPWRVNKYGPTRRIMSIGAGKYGTDPVIANVETFWSKREQEKYGDHGANAVHIATFDPPTVLALLDEIERLRREREEIADNVTRFALYDPDLNAWECQADDCRFWWEFEVGDPYDHDMRFCPRCGRRIVAEVRDVEDGEVEDGENDA